MAGAQFARMNTPSAPPPVSISERPWFGALAESVRPSLTKKVGLLLLLMWLGAVASLYFFHEHVAGSAADTHFVDVAARQRTLAQGLLLHAGMAALGREADRKALAREVDDFDRALVTLREGGRIRGGWLPKAEADVVHAVDALQAAWNALKPHLRLRADAPLADPLNEEPLVEARLPAVLEAVDGVLRAREAQVRARRERGLAVFGAGAIVALVLFGVGLWLTHYFIARPVRELASAVQRMREGDFSRPVPIVTRDELAAVARAFNELADKVAALRPPEVAPRDGAVPPRVDP